MARYAGLLLLMARLMLAGSLNIDDRGSILKTSKIIAADLISFYNGHEAGQTPGQLPYLSGMEENATGYYWWQSGPFMSSFIDYWHLTGDETYNELVSEGLLYQAGDKANFLPANWSAEAGNADQCIWALGAMTAAEYGFPNPPSDRPQWLDLAKRVFDEQAERWDIEEDKDTCNGGLRYKVRMEEHGFQSKTSTPNVCFFSLGARLARFTGNETYAMYADKTWHWLSKVNYLDEKNWQVYLGALVENNCGNVTKEVYTIDLAGLTEGAAFMYNYTNGSSTWQDRVTKLSTSFLDTFFLEDTLFEPFCEEPDLCRWFTSTYKGLSTRWLAVTTQMAPFTSASILTALRSSAESIISKCAGDEVGSHCNYSRRNSYSRQDDAMEAMAVLAAVSNLLIEDAPEPRIEMDIPKDSSGEEGDDSAANHPVSSTLVAVVSVCVLSLVLI